VSHLPEPFMSLGGVRICGNPGVLGHRFGDRRVEAAIQGVELVGGDRDPLLDGQFGDRLADLAVVVDDLGDVEPQGQQREAMERGARFDGAMNDRRRSRFPSKRLRTAGSGTSGTCSRARPLTLPRPGAHLLPGPDDDGVSIVGDELVQH
jgi:hypothetical protein